MSSVPPEQPPLSRRELRAAQARADAVAAERAAERAAAERAAAEAPDQTGAQAAAPGDRRTEPSASALPALPSASLPEPVAAPGAEPTLSSAFQTDAFNEVWNAPAGAPPDAQAPDAAEPATPPVGKLSRTSRRTRLADASPREKKSRKGAWGCLIVLVVLVALVAGAYLALQGPIQQLIAATQGPADYTSQEAQTGKDVVVMIHEGDGGSEIAKTLLEMHVVKSFDAFYDVLLKAAPEPVFQPGAYQLKTKMVASDALDLLTDPASKLDRTVVVPEGTATVDVLQSISEGTEIPLADLQAAAADVASLGLPAEATTLEGFLFPATYTFSPGETAHNALQTMVNRQYKALDSAGVRVADRWSTIVLASLIQREAGLNDDYYKVSRVFLNRLDPAQWNSGLLQSDATVAYGTGNTHLVTTTDAERADASNLYNTYVHPGMVVGPISNPGDLAIDAALHPADGTWLFFVTVNLDSGETTFSTTLAEHETAVAQWQAWMRENR